ncbi:MAG TPA: SprT-like domain-containing protein [Nitrospiraceae bacterium]|nr:SprT-like domain-containing protein [Nitrospiraceae bacterium]
MKSTFSKILFESDKLLDHWQQLNLRYFRGALPAIDIVWSPRLTASAGMFVSRVGPRARDTGQKDRPDRRVIRLSQPLLRDQPEAEIIGTLAHEMIHQWQYDIRKRRPDHGPEFRRMMETMNRDGLGITVRHSLDAAVQALSRYAWRCQQCGRDYRRQRHSIRPGRHRCGACRGRLTEITIAEGKSKKVKGKSRGYSGYDRQLALPFFIQ